MQERNSIVIKWESETTNILGFRVIYRFGCLLICCIVLIISTKNSFFPPRLFGTPQFKQGPPLAPSEREFKIKNVPDNECIVVCVVSLEEVSVQISVLIHQNDIFWTCLQNVDFKVEITPSNVPFPQCREIRTEGVGESKRLDNIIIPASTAIVVCVIVAVIIFIACLKVLKSDNHLFISLSTSPSRATRRTGHWQMRSRSTPCRCR